MYFRKKRMGSLKFLYSLKITSLLFKLYRFVSCRKSKSETSQLAFELATPQETEETRFNSRQ